MAEHCLANPDRLARAGMSAESIAKWAEGLAYVLEKDGPLAADMVWTALKMYYDWADGNISLIAVFEGFQQQVRNFKQIAADIRAAFGL